MINIKILILIMALFGLSSAPERADKPNEFSFSYYNCNYRGPYSGDLIDSIYDEAKNGNSIAAYYLFFGAGMIKKHVASFEELLQLMINNNNPAGYEVKGTLLFEQEKFDEGLFYFQMAAEQGYLGAISKIKEAYAGDKYPSLKNESLELYWSKRDALSGNIYNLKKFIVNNPEDLSELELSHWQKVYEILTKKNASNNDEKYISEQTKLILFQINENRKRLNEILKNNHPWYANYKDCK